MRSREDDLVVVAEAPEAEAAAAREESPVAVAEAAETQEDSPVPD